MGTNASRWFITCAALAALTAHLYWPEFKPDTVSLILVVVALTPWLAAVLKTVELPGGIKIEFQAVQEAGDKVTKSSSVIITPDSGREFRLMAFADRDPNLTLVALRIEIEKRLRALARRYEINERLPLRSLVRDLQKHEALDAPAASGLEELIVAGNSAAHGVIVAPEVAAWAAESGPRILAVLDAKVESRLTSA